MQPIWPVDYSPANYSPGRYDEPQPIVFSPSFVMDQTSCYTVQPASQLSQLSRPESVRLDLNSDYTDVFEFFHPYSSREHELTTPKFNSHPDTEQTMETTGESSQYFKCTTQKQDDHTSAFNELDQQEKVNQQPLQHQNNSQEPVQQQVQQLFQHQQLDQLPQQLQIQNLDKYIPNQLAQPIEVVTDGLSSRVEPIISSDETQSPPLKQQCHGNTTTPSWSADTVVMTEMKPIFTVGTLIIDPDNDLDSTTRRMVSIDLDQYKIVKKMKTGQDQEKVRAMCRSCKSITLYNNFNRHINLLHPHEEPPAYDVIVPIPVETLPCKACICICGQQVERKHRKRQNTSR